EIQLKGEWVGITNVSKQSPKFPLKYYSKWDKVKLWANQINQALEPSLSASSAARRA
ncbi:unnamed protein product, partial [marine sediment metagenome]